MLKTIKNALLLAGFQLILGAHAVYADTYRAGLNCSNPPNSLWTHASDTRDDVLACIGGVWQSMVFGKDNAFPKSHPLETASVGPYNCSAYTDASGTPHLSMIGANLYDAAASTHVLLGTNGGIDEVCLVDPLGISLNAGMQAAFFPWN